MIAWTLLVIATTVASAEPFLIKGEYRTPQAADKLHVEGEFPSMAGWHLLPWVRVSDYMTVGHTKFKSVRIFLKRIVPSPNAGNMTPEDFVQKNLRPMLMRNQAEYGPIDYNPVFEVVTEIAAPVGRDDLPGFSAEYRYDNPDGDMMAARYYVVRVGSRLHMVTYTGKMEEYNALKGRFEAFVDGLRFIH